MQAVMDLQADWCKLLLETASTRHGPEIPKFIFMTVCFEAHNQLITFSVGSPIYLEYNSKVILSSLTSKSLGCITFLLDGTNASGFQLQILVHLVQEGKVD